MKGVVSCLFPVSRGASGVALLAFLWSAPALSQERSAWVMPRPPTGALGAAAEPVVSGGNPLSPHFRSQPERASGGAQVEVEPEFFSGLQ